MKTFGRSILLTIYSICSIITILILAYLLYIHMQDGATCSLQMFGDCGEVNASRYAEILGVPIALLGILWVGSGIILGLLKLKFIDSRFLTMLLLMNGTWDIIFIIYLIIIEAFVLQTWCQYCLLADVFILFSVISVLLIFVIEQGKIKKPKGSGKPGSEVPEYQKPVPEKISDDNLETHKIKLKEVQHKD